MAVQPDTVTGTLTTTSGSLNFTTVGTQLQARQHLPGDRFLVNGLELQIATITGENSGTLTEPCPPEAAVSGFPVRLRWQPDGARIAAQTRNLIDLLGNGTLESLAGINGNADEIPIFLGPNTLTVINRSELVQGVQADAEVETLAERASFDNREAGFSVLVANIGDGRAALYFKKSNTDGDWSEPAYVTGNVGPVAQLEAGNTTTLPTGEDATVNIRPITDGYALDLGLPRGEKGEDGAVGPKGDGLQLNASGPLSERSDYDNESDGFTFFDTDNGNLYFKIGDDPGVWSDPIPFGKGDKGDPGDSGATIVTTNGVGNGTAGPYTLNEAPASTSATWASISGVTQYDFTLSGDQITFGIPVEIGVAWQVKSSGVLSVVVPADGSVGTAKIKSSEAAGIRNAIDAAQKVHDATAGHLAVFNPNGDIADEGVGKASVPDAQAGLNDTDYMTPETTAAAILALSPPSDTSDLEFSTSQLAIQLATANGNGFVFGRTGNRFADSFGNLNFVDVAGATNLNTSVAGLLKPTAVAGADQIPTMTGATTSGVTVTASDINTGAGFQAWFIGDKNNGTSWVTNNGMTSGWVRFDFGTPRTIGSYSILQRPGTPTQAPRDFILEGSNDNSAWTPLDSRSGIVSWTEGVANSYLITSPVPYRYYRLSIAAVQTGGIAIGIAELNLRTPGLTNNLTVRSTAFPAAVAPTKIKALFDVREVDAAVAGTDYFLDCSRDDGVTWTQMALAELFNNGTLRTVEAAETDLTGTPTGTMVRWRFRTANNKNVELHDIYIERT